VATQHLNVGGVLLQMGDVDAALEQLEEVLRLRDHQGVVMVTGYALVLLCQAHVWSGDLAAAQKAITQGREILESIDADGQLLDAGVGEAELRLALGDLEEAESLCRTVIAQAQAMGADLSEAQARCMLGRVQLARKDPAAAIPGLEACVALAEKSGSDYERARALAVLAEAHAACADGDGACEDTLAEAIRLFEKMGAHHDLEEAMEVRKRLESLSPGGG
jgi:tetratricopeptide (TPR) repeat protein